MTSNLVFLYILVSVTSLVSTVTHVYHDYIVIGAGPSGLQMGYFLQRAGRDYVILERSNTSGKNHQHLIYQIQIDVVIITDKIGLLLRAVVV